MASSDGGQPAVPSSVAMPGKPLLASDRVHCERRNHLRNKDDGLTMAAATASNSNNEATKPTMDPWLLMAASNGESEEVENLIKHQVRQTLVNKESHFIIHVPTGDPNTEGGDGGAGHPQNGRGESTDSQSTANCPCPVVNPASLDEVSLLDGVTLDDEGNSALHVVATSGDSVQYLRCAELIHEKAPHLLVADNKRGDTPLYCAARAGNLNMVSRLIELAAREKRATEFLRRKNGIGETALHGAVHSANKQVLEKIMLEDPELVHIPGDGVSPLYLAISLRRLDIALELIQRSSKSLPCSGPDGRNVLHAAVFQGEALSTLLKVFKDVEVEAQGDRRHRVPLLLDLTSQRDKNGSTPLHFAASLETCGNGFSRWFQRFWPKSSPTKLLLEANESAVYQADNKGWYPIHVAAGNGKLNVIMILLGRTPNCATLRDAEGRTFLHVAIEMKRYDIVKFVCQRQELTHILNAQDRHGNTALHLAVQVGLLLIFFRLLRNKQVCLDLSNKDGLTPRDLSWIVIPAGFYNKKNPRFLIHQALKVAGAAVGHSRPDHFYEAYTKRRDENADSEYLTNSAQVVGITSVLVATVTFAAAFTLPGGYRSDDHDNGGTPTFASRYTFQAFVISNTLSFICSFLATISLLYSGVGSRELAVRLRYHRLSRLLLHSSVRSLVAAFAMGMYVVLAPVALKLAMSVCVISFASLMFGNTGVPNFLILANTLRVRFGIGAASSQVRPILKVLFRRFWSYVLIFGLPAILKIHGTN